MIRPEQWDSHGRVSHNEACVAMYSCFRWGYNVIESRVEVDKGALRPGEARLSPRSKPVLRLCVRNDQITV